MTTDKYDVTGPDGELLTRLNRGLAARQNVTDEQLSALVLSHQLRHILFEAAKQCLDEPLKLKMLGAVFEALEFEQQELWNFPRSADHHMFWEFPGCTCPRMDNRERWGTGHSIIALNCPVHGHKVKKVDDRKPV